jgi:restriction endonuclease S subunit
LAVKEKKIARAAAPAVLREGWRVVRFDEMAQLVNNRVDNPSEAGVERYVGLEHLDPESLKIRRWGSPDDVEAQKLRFQPGDIIFGKRRAYQRKVAVADFEGICSAHAMVLRARAEAVVKEFLPFFMQSGTFFDCALSISVGSLSPTINWKTLASQQFAIPPKNDQRRIAEILSAADEAHTRLHNALLETESLKRTALTRLTTKGIGASHFKETEVGNIPSSWEVRTVGELLSLCQYGLSIPVQETGTYPMFRMMNIVDGVVVKNDMTSVDLPLQEFEKYCLKKGDILFNRTNSADLVGKVGIYRMEGSDVFASYLVRLRANGSLILPEYLNYYLNSAAGQARILVHATHGVSQSNINATNLKKVLVPVPPLEEQVTVIAALKKIDSAKTALQEKIEANHALKKMLLTSLIDAEKVS